MVEGDGGPALPRHSWQATSHVGRQAQPVAQLRSAKCCWRCCPHHPTTLSVPSHAYGTPGLLISTSSVWRRRTSSAIPSVRLYPQRNITSRLASWVGDTISYRVHFLLLRRLHACTPARLNELDSYGRPRGNEDRTPTPYLTQLASWLSFGGSETKTRTQNKDSRHTVKMSGEAWLYLLAVLINAVNLFLQVFFTIMYSDLEWYVKTALRARR